MTNVLASLEVGLQIPRDELHVLGVRLGRTELHGLCVLEHLESVPRRDVVHFARGHFFLMAGGISETKPTLEDIAPMRAFAALVSTD
jgi:hypothetical protein